jgi:hypothetical protein
MVIMQIADLTWLRVRADGDVLAEDFAQFATQFVELVGHRNESIPVLLELGPQVSLGQLRALGQQVQINAHHRRLLGAVAVVGDPGWAFPTHLISAFHTEPVRFFERGDEAHAESWLRQFAGRSDGSDHWAAHA